MKKEIGDLGHTGPYRPPTRLRKRTEFSSKGAADESRVFEANGYVRALCLPDAKRGHAPQLHDQYLDRSGQYY